METVIVQSRDKNEFQELLKVELEKIKQQEKNIMHPIQFSAGMFNRDVVKVGGYNKEYEAIKNASNPNYDPYDYSYTALIIYE